MRLIPGQQIGEAKSELRVPLGSHAIPSFGTFMHARALVLEYYSLELNPIDSCDLCAK
jgi:hypothetical protein